MRDPATLREPHFFPLRSETPHALLADIPGFCGVTLRDGKWMVNLSSPPTLGVAREIVRRVNART
jgi:hypothetical protein